MTILRFWTKESPPLALSEADEARVDAEDLQIVVDALRWAALPGAAQIALWPPDDLIVQWMDQYLDRAQDVSARLVRREVLTAAQEELVAATYLAIDAVPPSPVFADPATSRESLLRDTVWAPMRARAREALDALGDAVDVSKPIDLTW